ncbi:MAG: type II toxin-antitoxin system RelE/ParE family toxin [Chloroflexota bacterium]
MPYDIILSPEAAEDLRFLKANLRSEVKDALGTYLQHEPTETSKARIKRLRGISRPQYRLRVGDIRVFYDVDGSQVHGLAIVSKAEAEEWLRKVGR